MAAWKGLLLQEPLCLVVDVERGAAQPAGAVARLGDGAVQDASVALVLRLLGPRKELPPPRHLHYPPQQRPQPSLSNRFHHVPGLVL